MDVPLKMDRLKKWCEDINLAQKKIRYDFVFVDEEDYNKYKPDTFAVLLKLFTKHR